MHHSLHHSLNVTRLILHVCEFIHGSGGQFFRSREHSSTCMAYWRNNWWVNNSNTKEPDLKCIHADFEYIALKLSQKFVNIWSLRTGSIWNELHYKSHIDLLSYSQFCSFCTMLSFKWNSFLSQYSPFKRVVQCRTLHMG